jgi:hypothetical protein
LYDVAGSGYKPSNICKDLSILASPETVDTVPYPVRMKAAFRQERAMTRYYFNLVSPTTTVEDLEGTELSSLDAARREAIKDARQLMGAAILDGDDISNRRIEITNEAGEVLLVLPFTDAINPRD